MTRAAYSVTSMKFASLNGSHGTPYAHNALMRTWLNTAVVAVRAARCQPVTPPVVVTITVHRTRNARQDATNAFPSAKAAIDAAVQCGVLPDDDDTVIVETRIRAGAKAARPTLDVLIESASEAACGCSCGGSVA